MKARQILSALTILVLGTGLSASARDFGLKSPDGRIELTVSTGDSLTWAVSYNGEQLLRPSSIGMDIRDLSGKSYNK